MEAERVLLILVVFALAGAVIYFWRKSKR